MKSIRGAALFVYGAFYLTVNSAIGFEWPSHMPRCQSDDCNCVGKAMAYFINHGDDYSEVGIPRISPYKFEKPYSLSAFNPKSILKFGCNNPEVLVYGCENFEVSQVIGFKPDPNMNRFEFKLFAPALRTSEKVHLTAHFLARNFSAIGCIETQMENVVIHSTVDCEVVDRCGKQHVNVRNVRSIIVSIGEYSMKYESPHVSPLITGLLNGICNANWKLLYIDVKSQVECFVGDIIKSFMDPIFNGISLQEFYQQNAVEEDTCACAPGPEPYQID